MQVIVWVKGICSGAGQGLQPWLQASLHRNPSWGVGGSILILGLSSWGSCSSLHLVGQCQVLPLPSEGIRTQPPVPSCLCWCGVLLLFKTALEELLFRDSLKYPEWGTGFVSKPHNQDHRKGALFSCCFTAQNMY